MSTIEMKRNAFRVLATLALAAAPAFASPIFVANYSFETPPAGGNPFSNTCATGGCIFTTPVGIPGWTASATAGQMQPVGTTQFNSVADGSTFAFAGAGGTIDQVVGTVVEGWVYTLQVDVAQRKNKAFDGAFELLIGATPFAGSGTAPTSGDWSTWTATYTGLAADVGKTITIRLAPTSASGYYDNVRLDAAPEPASFLLIGPALLFLGLRKRRTVRS